MSEEYLSLYEFLGRAAGSNLGLKIHQIASRNGITIGERNVSNRKYTGKIKTYPKSFLVGFFSDKNQPTSTQEETDLPF
jgi:hypothetical protein